MRDEGGCWWNSGTLRGADPSASKAFRVECTRIRPAAVVREVIKLVPHIIIYRCVYTQDDNENQVARDPGQSESIPERAYGKITIGSRRDIAALLVDECKRGTQDGKNDPECVCNVTIRKQSPFAARGPRSEYVQGGMYGDHECSKV